MKVATRFGEIETKETECIRLSDGLVGIPHATRFVLIRPDQDSPFHWLQCLDDPSVSVAVISPTDFFTDYSFELQEADVERIGLSNVEDAVVLTTVTLDEQARRITTNLLGPIVVNAQTMAGKQVVLSNENYATKHVLFEQGVSAATQTDENLLKAA
ncbi:MAG: flagellar assembly protein FliW [Armatimonadetes bacterium]|nr:flagellar assembly protein FliW [Armatimonadota bacterium]